MRFCISGTAPRARNARCTSMLPKFQMTNGTRGPLFILISYYAVECTKKSKKKFTNISNIKFYAGCFDDECYRRRNSKRMSLVRTIQSTTSDPTFKVIEQFMRDACKEKIEK
jgi:hypothetical protein